MKYPPREGFKPLIELQPLIEEAIAQGGLCFQYTNCENCNERQDIQQPNVFYTSIQCEECGHVTDTKERGCGFSVIYSSDPESVMRAILKQMNEKE